MRAMCGLASGLEGASQQAAPQAEHEVMPGNCQAAATMLGAASRRYWRRAEATPGSALRATFVRAAQEKGHGYESVRGRGAGARGRQRSASPPPSSVLI